MLTPEQKADIARRNGALSRGPISAEGKEIVSRNALKHGQAAHKHIVLDCEDGNSYQSLLQSTIDCYQPANPVEFELVNRIAECFWRLRRSTGLETATLDDSLHKSLSQSQPEDETAAILTNAFHNTAHEGRLHNLERYESRAARSLDRALQQLHRLQARRTA